MGLIKGAEAEQANGETINIGSGHGITIGDLAATILAFMGCHAPIVLDPHRIRPAKCELAELVCDNAKALKLTRWRPRCPLEGGLKESIAFVSRHQDQYKPETYAA